MKKIVAVWPRQPRTDDSKYAALVLAGMLIIVTVTALFRFDQFVPVVADAGLPGAVTGHVLAALLMGFGVLAVPFLLRMKLSVGLRWTSMAAGWVVTLLWLLLSVWMNITGASLAGFELLGTGVELVVGWWMVCMAVSLCILSAWASWGLWPGKRAPLETRQKK